MLNELKRTLEVLKRLNQKCENSIIKDDEFTEQEENIEDYAKLINDFNKLLNEFNSIDFEDKDVTNEKLVNLHLKYSDCIWHLEQLHELVKRMAGKFPS